jgi:predicted 3-demethylubiquinone-9 3-methyltransferase (glyoxalase superfamily)
MKPITPHLWFDKDAKEAAQFYCSVFPNSKITSVRTLRDTPSGDCDVVAFEMKKFDIAELQRAFDGGERVELAS